MFSISDTHENSRSHAIVIGGSIAGLLAARVLTNHFTRVTIIERDYTSDTAEFRKGVPQARHGHVLLGRGQAIMEQLFPGFIDELRSNGGVALNMGRDFALYVRGAWSQPFTSAIVNTLSSRPLLEQTLYRRLVNNPQVQVLFGGEVLAVDADESGTRVTGVHLQERGASGQRETFLPANLVVDASGRGSRTPEWLTRLGYPTPQETTVNAFPGYATRIYRRPVNFSADWKGLYLMPRAPTSSRGGVILPIEADEFGPRWHVGLVGMAKDYPPTDAAGFLEFARTMPSTRLYDAIKDAEPLTAPYGYRRAENRLRYYEKLPRYLEGLLVCGDAVSTFNPVYSQGMTVAALGSLVLDEALTAQQKRKPHGDLTGLAKQFQKKLAVVIADPWQLATGQDSGWPIIEGAKQSDLVTRQIHRYFNRVLSVLPYNTLVAEAFFHVQNMFKSPMSLFHPRIVWQVLRTQPPSPQAMATQSGVPSLDTSIATIKP
jgi:2-polyprenyl-6-methoxyphenol hydroxylase-like FAD-dependent oxidoreductase